MNPGWYLPKKLILLIDITLTFLSLILAYLIRFDFIDFYDLFLVKEYDTLIIGVPVLLSIRFLSFLIAKTHKGIIRHFSNDDAHRIFFTITLGTILISFLSILKYNFIDGRVILPKSVIIIEYLGTLFLLLSSRLSIKQIFFTTNKKKGEKINILKIGRAHV